VIDLLIDGAKKAKDVVDQFKPVIPRAEYTQFMKKLVE
jgi:hypothetical protein